jgi:hypothetical protein
MVVILVYFLTLITFINVSKALDTGVEQSDVGKPRGVGESPYLLHPEPCLKEIRYLVSKSPILRQRAFVSVVGHLANSSHVLVSTMRGESKSLSKKRSVSRSFKLLAPHHVGNLVSLVIGDLQFTPTSTIEVIATMFGFYPSLFCSLLPELPLEMTLSIISHIIRPTEDESKSPSWTEESFAKVIRAIIAHIQTLSKSLPQSDHHFKSSSRFIAQLKKYAATLGAAGSQLGSNNIDHQIPQFVSIEAIEDLIQAFSKRYRNFRLPQPTAKDGIERWSGTGDPGWVPSLVTPPRIIISPEVVEDHIKDLFPTFVLAEGSLSESTNHHETISAALPNLSLFTPSYENSTISFLDELLATFTLIRKDTSTTDLNPSHDHVIPDNEMLQRVLEIFQQSPSFDWSWSHLITSLSSSLNSEGLNILPLVASILLRLSQEHNLSGAKFLQLFQPLILENGSHFVTRLENGPKSNFTSKSAIGLLFMECARSQLTSPFGINFFLLDTILQTIRMIHSQDKCNGPCCTPEWHFGAPLSRASSILLTSLRLVSESQISLPNLIISTLLSPDGRQMKDPFFSWFWCEIISHMMLNWNRFRSNSMLKSSFQALHLLPSQNADTIEGTELHFDDALESVKETFFGAIVFHVEREKLIATLNGVISSFFDSRTEFQKCFPEATVDTRRSSLLAHILELADLRDRVEVTIITNQDATAATTISSHVPTTITTTTTSLSSAQSSAQPSTKIFSDRILGRILSSLPAEHSIDLARLLHHHKLAAFPKFWIRGQWSSWIMSSMQDVRRTKNFLSVLQSRLPFESRKYLEELSLIFQGMIDSGDVGTVALGRNHKHRPAPAPIRQIYSDFRAMLKSFTRSHNSWSVSRWQKARVLRMDHTITFDPSQKHNINAGITMLVKLLRVIENVAANASSSTSQTLKVVLEELDNVTFDALSGTMECLVWVLTVFTPVELWQQCVQNNLWNDSSSSLEESQTDHLQELEKNDGFKAFRKHLISLTASLCQFTPQYRSTLSDGTSPLPPHTRRSIISLSSERMSSEYMEDAELPSMLDTSASQLELAHNIETSIRQWIAEEISFKIPNLYSLWVHLANAVCKSGGKPHLIVLIELISGLRDWLAPGIFESVLSDRLVYINTSRTATAMMGAADYRAMFALSKLLLDGPHPFPLNFSILFNPSVLQSCYLSFPNDHYNETAAPLQLLLSQLLSNEKIAEQLYLHLPLFRERFLWLLCRQKPLTASKSRTPYISWKMKIQELELDLQSEWKSNPSSLLLNRDRHQNESIASSIITGLEHTHWNKVFRGNPGWDCALLEQRILKNLQSAFEAHTLAHPTNIHDWDESISPGIPLIEPSPETAEFVPPLKRNVPFCVFLAWELEASLCHQSGHVDSSSYINHLSSIIMTQITLFPMERTTQLLSALIQLTSGIEDRSVERHIPAVWHHIWRESSSLCFRLSPLWLIEILLHLPQQIPLLRKPSPIPLATSANTEVDRHPHASLAAHHTSQFAVGVTRVLRRLALPNQLIPLVPLPPSLQEGLVPRLFDLLRHPVMSSSEYWMGWIWSQILEHMQQIQHDQLRRDHFMAHFLPLLHTQPNILQSFANHWYQAYASYWERTEPWIAQMIAHFLGRFPPPSPIPPTHHFESALSELVQPNELYRIKFFSSTIFSDLEAQYQEHQQEKFGKPANARPSASTIANSSTSKDPHKRPSRVRQRLKRTKHVYHSKLDTAVAVAHADTATPKVPVYPLIVPSAHGDNGDTFMMPDQSDPRMLNTVMASAGNGVLPAATSVSNQSLGYLDDPSSDESLDDGRNYHSDEDDWMTPATKKWKRRD